MLSQKYNDPFNLGSDPFGFNALLKQLGGAVNEGVEQARRAIDCKMRRFYRVHQRSGSITAHGVVFPDGTVVMQHTPSESVSIYKNIELAAPAECIRWIDVESPCQTK